MKVQLLIEMDEKGSITVNAPIGDRRVCYAMLELARDAIKDFSDKARLEQPRVVPANGNDVAAINRDRRLAFDRNGVSKNGR